MTATRAAARCGRGRGQKEAVWGAIFTLTTTNSIKILLKLNKYFIILHILPLQVPPHQGVGEAEALVGAHTPLC